MASGGSSKPRLQPVFLSSSRLQLFVVVVWNFELYMLPLALLLLLVWNFVFSSCRETAEMVGKVGKHCFNVFALLHK